MITLSARCKKLLLISIVLFLGTFSFLLKAQNPNIDFTYSVDSIKTDNVVTYHVTIAITKGTGLFSIGIYEDLLRKGLVELDKKENITEHKVSLTFTGKKSCIIYVRNNKDCAIKPLNFNNKSL